MKEMEDLLEEKAFLLHCQKLGKGGACPSNPQVPPVLILGIFFGLRLPKYEILISIVLGNAIQFDKDERLRRLIHSALRYYKSCSENIILFERKQD